MTEDLALRRFYRRVNAHGPKIRLDMLKRHAAIRVPRPAGWDRLASPR